jgi:alanyl-tRNA synthetase
LTKQKDRSRAATAIETEDWVVQLKKIHRRIFWLRLLNSQVEIVKYRKVSQKQKEFYQLVFSKLLFIRKVVDK